MAVDRNEALARVQQIYGDVGHALDAGDIADMDNRIRNGQSLTDIVANTYDQAVRRFKVADTPTTRAQEAQGLVPTYDSQLNAGRSFDPPAVMLEELVTGAREQAPMMNSSNYLPSQRSTPGNTPRYNIGPADAAFGMAGGGVLGMSWGTLALIAAGGVILVVAYRHFGK